VHEEEESLPKYKDMSDNTQMYDGKLPERPNPVMAGHTLLCIG